MTPSPLIVHALQKLSFQEAWELQRAKLRTLVEEGGPDELFFVEHPPVITLGTSGNPNNVLVSPAELALNGIEVVKIERGGDVTYHGPGQLVAYPLLDLKKKKRDIAWYMRGLEEVVIRTLARFDVGATRIPGKTGVWVVNRGDQSVDRKIASLGVKLSRWCTMHGFAVNVRGCKEGFKFIHPCGMKDIEVTSLEEELGIPPPSLRAVSDEVARNFLEVFSFYSISCPHDPPSHKL